MTDMDVPDHRSAGTADGPLWRRVYRWLIEGTPTGVAGWVIIVSVAVIILVGIIALIAFLVHAAG